MNKKIGEFMIWANDNNWDITKKSGHQLNLDSSIISRYHEIPNEYLDFLTVVKRCITPDEMTWFICEDEFNNSADTEFKWNEYELLSLEAAMDDDRLKSEITAWWDNYLPIIMSVNGGYSFYAIDLTIEKGAIVRGYEPEFEEVEKVANTLEEFFELIMANSIEF
ncbi:SMI1/KNR4 family protein [Paenibacillus sp. PAMC21692]|uniref:SMI1/KNR4 family protein n=1 Tax=Paenibacillus sp. PAMC21692 TaxID=2762320 RepID=UPI00164E6958|nr:SMI1/KNR4 family protein [Paenibacillus sp. PAMC21692]QNK59200.1 SMI1/KNR4 family protein [Paenibacillus sp. PAMC21692]